MKRRRNRLSGGAKAEVRARAKSITRRRRTAMLIHTLPYPVSLLIHHLHIIGRTTAKLFLEVGKGGLG